MLTALLKLVIQVNSIALYSLAKKNNNIRVTVCRYQCQCWTHVKVGVRLITCRVCSEDGFDNVSCQIIPQAIAAIRLRSNVCL